MRVLAVLAPLALGTAVLAAPQPAAAAPFCLHRSVTIVAHEDDDLLFANPDIRHDLDGWACETTVYLTAGDAGEQAAYWQERELGPVAAYSSMLGVSESAWTTGAATYAGHTVTTRTSPDGRVTTVYLRLPDGGISGAGFDSTGDVSLMKLWDGRIGSIAPLDGRAAYTSASLSATLRAIVDGVQARIVRIQDARDGQNEHSDHTAAGWFALQALSGYTGTVISYRGYGAESEAANVSGLDLTRKVQAVQRYATHDPLLCDEPATCDTGIVATWTRRQYTAPLPVPLQPVPGPAPYNGPDLARNARVTASSQAPGQAATAAIDGVAAGWPVNGGAEWSSAGQRAGAWLQLTWAGPQTIDRVYLYDRPNGSDRVTGAMLTFSDGSTISVPALNDNGDATIVTFPARSVTTLRMTVTSVSASTQNIGLSEIEAYHGDPTPVVPEPDPVPGPAPYDGPDVARNALVAASSEAPGQGATRAIDAVISGWPANGGAEWSSNGQRAGAWLQLTWTSPQTIDRVYLYDRPNGNDRITAGTLTFSDGSTVPVPALNNDGSATIITFTSRTVTTLRLSITGTSSTTENIGLSEIEAYHGDPTPVVPEPDPVPGPAPYDGPDVARNALVAASSEAPGQGATRAIDAVISGWPANGGAEWSSAGQRAGAWLQLTWTSPQTIDRVYLYDRPNGNDRITAGTLTFSDGTTVPVPALNNDGSATIITFPARTVTTLRLSITGTSTTTENIGLSEIEAYHGDPSGTAAAQSRSAGSATGAGTTRAGTAGTGGDESGTGGVGDAPAPSRSPVPVVPVTPPAEPAPTVTPTAPTVSAQGRTPDDVTPTPGTAAGTAPGGTPAPAPGTGG